MTDLRVANSDRSQSHPAARLHMLTGNQQGREHPLSDRVTTIGRGINNDIVLSDSQTSRKHVEIVRENNVYTAIDQGSANGFYINEQQSQRAILKDGDIITIGLVRMAFKLVGSTNPPISSQPPGSTGLRLQDSPPTTLLPTGTGSIPIMPPPGAAVSPPSPPVTIDERSLEQINLRSRPLTSIGREQTANDILLDNPQISRRHCQVVNQGGAFTLTDLRSTNGTFVNGNRLTTPAPLNDGDLINIGPYRFMFSQGLLYRSQDDDSVRVDVVNLSKQISKDVSLLHNCTFTILPREFVAIVGGSGTGKSTLLDSISGVRPATGGAVLYNKSDYYAQMEVYRSAIGYVPQDDIVPAELTVYRALYYAARLRLPQDTTEAEINERLEDVMDDLSLTQRRDTQISLLSGGQRKRVSIAAELISKPSLFFLDEPTSGLDPGLESRMMQLLRKLADQGRTVLLITHATQNVELCDRVIFLARGGYVAFYGAPKDALEYFKVSKFTEIYNKLDQERTPEEWANQFLVSPFYNKNIISRLRAIANEAEKFGIHLEQNPGASTSGSIHQPTPTAPQTLFRGTKVNVSALRQLNILTRRYFETLTRDRKNLLILLLQSPIIALLLLLVFNRGEWDDKTGNFSSAKTLVFLLTIVSVWFGTNNAAREIVKERNIYRRERRIGLKIAPYIFSKLVVQTILIIVQVLVLMLIVWLVIGLNNPTPEFLFYIFFTLLLTALGGVAMGLLISALTNNSDRATSFVPVVLIPQIIFSGAVVSLDKMGLIGTAISNLTITRWGYGAVGKLTELDKLPSPKIKFSGPPPEFANDIEKLFRGGIKFENGDWYLLPKREADFDTGVYLQWGYLGIIILVCMVLIFIFQLLKDKDYSK